jgi:serine/threonine protein kinase
MKSAGRYEIHEVLGEGGMGIVYRALDPAMNNREVTVKTIKDPQDKAALELFKREINVLASLSHPNIVAIYDIGEIEEGGAKRPYFVMPLLKGVTLQELINASSPRLTVERSVYMISQICRGLQFAHENQLVHRDLKPSNLFVLHDDSVKVIDFGVAHLANHLTVTGLKGTFMYMAPEQVQRKQPSALSDQFSVAVVCYEMLARRHPFSTSGQEDLEEAILHYNPPPVSDFNPLVNPSISQVIHKALAKKPLYRFASIREFSDCLERARRNEPIDIFNPERIGPRLERARKAFEAGDLDDATEIISELEAENYLAPEIAQLQKQIEETRRTRTVRQLLETAQRRFNEEEYIRALQKVQEALDLDPTNTEAFRLKGAIDSKRSATQIEEWLRVAGQHLENRSYAHARQALGKVLDFRPKEVRAQTLLAEVERQEQEHIKLRSEKQQAYQSALHAYERGEVNSALNKLERLLDLDRRAPDSTSPEMGTAYQKLYEEVRSKHDHLSYQEAEARRLLNEGDFAAARSICDEVLTAYPTNVLFRFLRDDVEQADRLEISAFIARVEREVAAERDLNCKVSILREARDKYPSEPRLEQSLQQVQARRDRVDVIASRARALEEAAQFSEAIEQWQMLRSIYPQYPGLDIEIDRLHRRREQRARDDVKAQWISLIDQALALRNYARATTLTADALKEFPGDAELAAMASVSDQQQARTLEADEKANRGKQMYGGGLPQEGLELLREACRLDPQSLSARSALLETLLNEATRQVDLDWRAAEPFVREALELDPSNPLAKSLGTLIQDKQQGEEVSLALATAREMQARRNTRGAIQELDKVGARYPQEKRLAQFRAVLFEGLSTDERAELRADDLKEVTDLVKESKETSDVDALESIFKKTHVYVRYRNDAEFRGPLSEIEERLRKKKEAVEGSASSSVAPTDGATTEEAVTQGRPGSWERYLPIWKEFLGKWVAVFGGAKLKVFLVSVGSTLAVLALIGLFRYVMTAKSLQKPTSVVATVGTVNVKNASIDEYKIFDAKGADVTDKSLVGLAAGGYKLVARRSGFQTEEVPFTLDPPREARTVLQVPWKALPAELTVKLIRGGGALKIDGVDRSPGNSSPFKAPWHNGPHSISWQPARGDSVEIQFDVNNTAVSMKPLALQDSVVGFVAVLSQTEITYQAFNMQGGIEKIVEGQPEPLSAAGTFRIQGTTPVEFKTLPKGDSLGGLQPEAAGQPMIYVYLAPKRSSGGKPRPKANELQRADQAGSNENVSPIGPTEEELRQKAKAEERQKYLEELHGKGGAQKQ